MKTKKLCLLPALIAVLNLIPAGRATAQTFRTLHSFTAGILSNSENWPYYFNGDGFAPTAGLVLSGNTLYGAAGLGGWWGSGTLFAVNTDGTGFTNLHNFELPDMHGGYVPETNPDGIKPNGLILSGNTLYGTAEKGGFGYDSGTLFAVNTDGTGFTNLHNFTANYGRFTNWDGANPKAGLILSGNTLYGTASVGGGRDSGTVFALNRNGTGFTNLHSFTGGTNGAFPYAGLILLGNSLYGTTTGGGSSGNGTVFAVSTSGTGFTILHSFTVTHTNSSGVYTNSDGAGPAAGLILSGNTLYGTASGGGSGGVGVVFAVKTDGTGFTNLHNFTATSGPPPYGNSDGANPQAALVLSGSTLYGTTTGGGSSGNGTVFAVRTDGTGFTNLHSFTAISGSYSTNSDGAYPRGGLTLSGNTLYGTTTGGGSLGSGTVFSLSLPLPQLTITRSGANVIVTWPTNVAGFDSTGYTLQSTTNLALPNSWFPVAQSPATNVGQVSVTLPGNVGSKFFRLKSQ